MFLLTPTISLGVYNIQFLCVKLEMMNIYIEFSSLGDASFKHFLCACMIGP